eukprot:TRINITY_DN4516_c4_g1_i2.p1 TRINITY_DN4516_c4_g1~~TRINITY_DN4516_c4_g1_i2.p1  ORF type:complete len:128 (-),score=49.07 TRINITY_DN4516_c4_g1_i2:19-402(-)
MFSWTKNAKLSFNEQSRVMAAARPIHILPSDYQNKANELTLEKELAAIVKLSKFIQDRAQTPNLFVQTASEIDIKTLKNRINENSPVNTIVNDPHAAAQLLLQLLKEISEPLILSIFYHSLLLTLSE